MARKLRPGEYPKRKVDWVGLAVRTVVPLRNGHVEIPVGTEMEVVRNWSGLTLIAPRCACCGIAPVIRKVAEHCVRPIREEGA